MFVYETCCVNSTARLINAMTDRKRTITWRTFIKHVKAAELSEVFPIYNWGHGPTRELRMKNDWAVSYHKSMYGGRPCYYVAHSAIEYIFTEATP